MDLTAAGAILGSPDYMAPEQARDARAADVRSDIYSLGCVLYHAVAGQVPFPDGNLVRKMVKHATQAPKPLRDLSPDAPEGLQQVLDRMLAKDPAQRYPTPELAARELRVFLGGGPARSRGPEGNTHMKAYLEWLKSQQLDEEASPPPAAPAAPEPAAPAQPADPAAPVSVDVELVPPPPPAPDPPRKVPGPPWRLSNRDLILMGASAGAVVVAVAVGLFVTKWFSPPPAPTPTDTQTAPRVTASGAAVAWEEGWCWYRTQNGDELWNPTKTPRLAARWG
jgi:serine/threonine protein kinase